MTAVINLHHGLAVLDEPDVVRIDRATQWGNRYVIGRDGDRAEVIARYRAWLWRAIGTGEIELAALAALKDQRLACWCFPAKPCHGHVLSRAAAWAASIQNPSEPLPACTPEPRAAESLTIPGNDIVGRLSFRPVNPNEARIHDPNGDCIGTVYRDPDTLTPGRFIFAIHLDEDPRGPYRVRAADRIRDLADRKFQTHPLYG